MTVEHRDARGLNDIELELVDDGHGAALRLHEETADEDRPEHATVEQRILRALAQAEEPLSKARIRSRAAARNASVVAAIERLAQEGRIERAPKGGYRLAAAETHRGP